MNSYYKKKLFIKNEAFMKSVMMKLNHVVKLLSFGDFPKQQELFQEFESLKKIFNSPVSSELFPEIIKKLKNNLFYRQFKLYDDSLFLTVLARKIQNFKVMELILLSSEINYSLAEEMALKQRRNILLSLALLEQDLQENKVPNQEDHYDDVYDIYFDDLGKLNEIFTADSIFIENIKWFFESDLFEFISGSPDSFDVKLTDLYGMLLENTKIKTSEDFIAHEQLLEEAQKKNYLDYKKFYAILSATKKQLAENLRTSSTTSTSSPIAITSHNIFKKIPKLKLSPTTKKALLNNLKNYKDSPYVNSLKR